MAGREDSLPATLHLDYPREGDIDSTKRENGCLAESNMAYTRQKEEKQ